MKTNLSGDLASALLAPAAAMRFSDLFRVASRKSFFSWTDGAITEAQVVLLDASSNPLHIGGSPPCVIWIGRDKSPAGLRHPWVGRLAQDFTLADLIDVLDRAAVFLLDWRAHRSSQAALSAAKRGAQAGNHLSDSERSQSERPAQALQSDRYRLAAWVFLGPPFEAAGFVNALALLARQSVTMKQLQTHSGLQSAQLEGLLEELLKREVLQVQRTPIVVPAAPSSKSAAPTQQNFVNRFSKWLKGASRV